MWRVSRALFSLNGIQTHTKMHYPAGWRVSCVPPGACLLSRPEVRLVDELGGSVLLVRNHATQVALVPCVHPLETWVQRVKILWFNSDWVSTHRWWFVLNWPRGLWLFSSRVYIPLHCFAFKDRSFWPKRKCTFQWRRKNRISAVNMATSNIFNVKSDIFSRLKIILMMYWWYIKQHKCVYEVSEIFTYEVDVKMGMMTKKMDQSSLWQIQNTWKAS